MGPQCCASSHKALRIRSITNFPSKVPARHVPSLAILVIRWFSPRTLKVVVGHVLDEETAPEGTVGCNACAGGYHDDGRLLVLRQEQDLAGRPCDGVVAGLGESTPLPSPLLQAVYGTPSRAHPAGQRGPSIPPFHPMAVLSVRASYVMPHLRPLSDAKPNTLPSPVMVTSAPGLASHRKLEQRPFFAGSSAPFSSSQ